MGRFRSFGPEVDNFDLARVMRNDKDPNARRAAALASTDTYDILRATKDDIVDVRTAAVLRLGELGEENELNRMLSEYVQPDYRVRQQAALATCDKDNLAKALKDPHPRVREAACIRARDLEAAAI